ncbi:hypothetical protein AJ80_09087 [Polytolypa hystricis UAMH7299]|uniref:Sulfite oxidase n=1 Tax=Polytolypa hystricis (strain UAMH7299) TaxID=1447883 RepID=A0A2B7WW67_POLH7|nr:hypothetical protein AJ80_09087 [Polytolypa hystricis UAMH7299]
MESGMFKEERNGWSGYVEWKEYPKKKEAATEVLTKLGANKPPEFQFNGTPTSNTMMEGRRWKVMHTALGFPFSAMPSTSWNVIRAEKASEMRHVLEFPYNGEPLPDKLAESEITPNRHHYVRNHGGIPSIDPNAFELEVNGLVNQARRFTLQELQNEAFFPQRTVAITMQCSGNRRSEALSWNPGEGDELTSTPWEQGAISTAKWTGISLKKIIKVCCGFNPGAKHVEFFGADTYIKHNVPQNYTVSIPITKVQSNEVLLCWKMNDESLPKSHGFPLRAMVLGYIGARSCKWLYKIRALEAPSESPIQRKEYLHYGGQIGKHNGSFSDGIPLQEMPVSSAIMSPRLRDIVLHEGKIHVSGWAYSGGGRWPERVEVSPDGGCSWFAVPASNLTRKYRHAWRLWNLELPVQKEAWVELRCRCFDNAVNTQPADISEVWNWCGHLINSQHRVTIYSVNKGTEAARRGLESMSLQGVPLAPITAPSKLQANPERESCLFAERDPDN